MVTRTARGRRLAASAVGLLTAWAIVAVTGAVHAQQFAQRAEFSTAYDDTIIPEESFQQAEPPEYWGNDCGA